jgi:homoserine dehydrogenase
VDVVLELAGGLDPAGEWVRQALNAGKSVVTANKKLIAYRGIELQHLAQQNSCELLYGAAVAGGVPVIPGLQQGLAGDQILKLEGILNGTCNFILSEMERSERSFAEVLSEAQRLGYAEADPTTDVGGFDAAHKICILAAIAFGGAPNMAAAEIEGIADVELIDIRLARELGYRIKLIASAERRPDGAAVRVNALFVEGGRIGRIYVQGPGAGGSATAAAVAADLADLASGGRRPVFHKPAAALEPLPGADRAGRKDKAFMRIMVKDRAGVIAALSEALAEADVSIDSFLQKPVEDSGHVPIVLITHPASPLAIEKALVHIAALEALVEPPRRLRVAPI